MIAQDFKATIINMLKDLKENIQIWLINKQTAYLSREVATIKANSRTEMYKNMKNSMEN